MDLIPSYRHTLSAELDAWHRTYLPIKGGTVLDVGAGCGETARFYLLHGANRVIAIEGNKDAFERLAFNFLLDTRVTPIRANVDDIKIDIEGSEDGLVVEWHGSRKETRYGWASLHPSWISRFHVTETRLRFAMHPLIRRIQYGWTLFRMRVSHDHR